ncbi:hypothetical protein DIPPA_34605, partial [Diplonema papillatum]
TRSSVPECLGRRLVRPVDEGVVGVPLTPSKALRVLAYCVGDGVAGLSAADTQDCGLAVAVPRDTVGCDFTPP